MCFVSTAKNGTLKRANSIRKKLPPKKVIAPVNGQFSMKEASIVLDREYVGKYLRMQEEKETNQRVIDVDIPDTSVKYDRTDLASPKTKKLAKMSERIANLEKENRELKKNFVSLKNDLKMRKDKEEIEQTNAAPNAAPNAAKAVDVNLMVNVCTAIDKP